MLYILSRVDLTVESGDLTVANQMGIRGIYKTYSEALDGISADLRADYGDLLFDRLDGERFIQNSFVVSRYSLKPKVGDPDPDPSREWILQGVDYLITAVEAPE